MKIFLNIGDHLHTLEFLSIKVFHRHITWDTKYITETSMFTYYKITYHIYLRAELDYLIYNNLVNYAVSILNSNLKIN